MRTTSPTTRTPSPQRAWNPAVTDMELVTATRDGDEDAFGELVRRHTPRVTRVVRGILRSDAEVEDAVQQTFVNAWKALGGFRENARPGTWIYRIAVNTALMRRRSRSRRREVPMDVSVGDEGDVITLDPIDDHTAADDIWARQIREQITAAVDELDEKYRVVFLMRDVEGMSIRDTAEALDMSEAAIKSRLHRARLHLRASLLPLMAH